MKGSNQAGVFGYYLENAPNFLAKALNSDHVVKLGDGSLKSKIFEVLGNSEKDGEVIKNIVDFIGKMTGPDYGRKQFLDGDLQGAVVTLKKLVGKETAVVMLESLALESTDFGSWFELKKANAMAYLEQTPWKGFGSEFQADKGPFDKQHELEWLKELAEKTPIPVPLLYDDPMDSDDMDDEGWGGSYNILDIDLPLLQEQKQVEYKRITSEKGKSWELELLDSSSVEYYGSLAPVEWEEGKAINFYNRFTPKVNNGVWVTPDNYLEYLVDSASQGTSKGTNPDTYFNFLCGKVDRSVENSRPTEALNIKNIYRVFALGTARATVLAFIESRVDDAITELNQIREFLISSGSLLKLPEEQSLAKALLDKIDDLENEFDQNREFVATVDQGLPKSADSFFMYHHKYDKARQIPDFRQLLGEKIKWYIANDIANNAMSLVLNKDGSDDMLLPTKGASISRFVRLVRETYQKAAELYKIVEQEDVPIYWEAKDKLEFEGRDSCVIFGRDGRILFTALKADDFGLGDKVLKYVVITRKIRDSWAGATFDNQRMVVDYLQQNGATLDFTFIDTGYRGSIPEYVINLLAQDGGYSIPSSEVDQKIMLLSSSELGRKELSRNNASSSKTVRHKQISHIEDTRPKNIHAPESLVMDDSGRIKPLEKPMDIKTQLLAWVVEHVALRNFAPRLNPEKRVEYYKKNPLDGYRFVEDLSGGAVISTHPIEMWEGPEGEKVLVKGGPEHTVVADFVGNKFLSSVAKYYDMSAPETELINVNGEKKLKINYLDEPWKAGGLNLPEEFRESLAIKSALLVDALLGQYDRTPWNFMFRPADKFRTSYVAFIDNGACLTSRARGGFKGFPEHFDVEQLKEILSNPQFKGQPVNEAYHNLIEVIDGKIIVKQPEELSKFIDDLKYYVTDEKIDEIIEQAGFLNGRRSIRDLEKRIALIEDDIKGMYSDSDIKRANDAIATYKRAIEVGGEATYLKMAIKSRKADILNLFTPLV